MSRILPSAPHLPNVLPNFCTPPRRLHPPPHSSPGRSRARLRSHHHPCPLDVLYQVCHPLVVLAVNPSRRRFVAHVQAARIPYGKLVCTVIDIHHDPTSPVVETAPDQFGRHDLRNPSPERCPGPDCPLCRRRSRRLEWHVFVWDDCHHTATCLGRQRQHRQRCTNCKPIAPHAINEGPKWTKTKTRFPDSGFPIAPLHRWPRSTVLTGIPGFSRGAHRIPRP